MEISGHFIKNYLTAGITKDNYIFTKCGKDFLSFARESLSNDCNGVKSCCVDVNNKDLSGYNNLIIKCCDEIQKKVVAREYVLQKFLIAMLKNEKKYEKEFEELRQQNLRLSMGDLKALFSNYSTFDIEDLIGDIGKIELNFFLTGVDSVPLQRAINNYISSRTPYSVKIFSDMELCTHCDQAGNIIECPHDYLTVDIKCFTASKTNNDGR